MTTRQNLDIRQGATWSFVYTKRDAAGTAVDLTGYTARMTIRDRIGGALQAYLSTDADARGGSIALGGAAGTITLSMTAAQSGALATTLASVSVLIQLEEPDWNKPTVTYVYDLEIVSGAGAVTRELEGQVLVHREITT